LTQQKQADPSKMSAKERREYQRCIWTQKNKVFQSFGPGHDPIDDIINHTGGLGSDDHLNSLFNRFEENPEKQEVGKHSFSQYLRQVKQE
jgi:hypothetical protein